MAWLICRTRKNTYAVVNTEKIVRISIIYFQESGNYKVSIYPNEFEVIPIDVTLKSQDDVTALLTILQADGYYIIENGEIHVWKGQDLFKDKEGVKND